MTFAATFFTLVLTIFGAITCWVIVGLIQAAMVMLSDGYKHVMMNWIQIQAAYDNQVLDTQERVSEVKLLKEKSRIYIQLNRLNLGEKRNRLLNMLGENSEIEYSEKY